MIDTDAPSGANYNLGLSNPASKPPTDILRLIAKNLTEMVLAYDMDRKLGVCQSGR